jgi:hypothetical protein
MLFQKPSENGSRVREPKAKTGFFSTNLFAANRIQSIDVPLVRQSEFMSDINLPPLPFGDEAILGASTNSQ